MGTKFKCRQTKPSPEGYSHAERQYFLGSAHLLLHNNLSKEEVGQYLLHFFNFGWGQNLNADRQNHLPRAIPTRSAIEFLLCTSPPSYQSIKKRSRSIPIMLLKFWVGTRFVTPKGKNMSPEGYSHAERKFFFTLHTFSFIPIY